MNELHLDAEEMEILRDLLKHVVGEMDVEVFRTDTRDFKSKLKHRREVLEHILAKIDRIPIAA